MTLLTFRHSRRGYVILRERGRIGYLRHTNAGRSWYWHLRLWFPLDGYPSGTSDHLQVAMEETEQKFKEWLNIVKLGSIT